MARIKKPPTTVGRKRVPAKDVAGPSKPKRRYRPGTKALREIRKFQKTTHQLLARAGFTRLVREIASEFKTDARFTRSALEALQEGSEAFLVQAFQDFQHLAEHGNRVTVMLKDIDAAKKLRCLGPAFRVE